MTVSRTYPVVPGTTTRFDPVSSSTIESLRAELAPDREALRAHVLFSRLRSPREFAVFLEHQAFVAWSAYFQLKALQRELSCVDVTWLPRGDPLARRLVNEIVLIEESDALPGGGYASRFEILRAALADCGADTSRLDATLSRVRRGENVATALALSDAPPAARRRVLVVLDGIHSVSVPWLVGAFTLGDEACAPDALRARVDALELEFPGRYELSGAYFDRQAQLERERVSPRGLQLLGCVCGDDEARWDEARAGARFALRTRRDLWDEIAAQLAPPAELARAPLGSTTPRRGVATSGEPA